MKKPTHSPLNAAQREALEARFALRLSARLESGAQALPHDISERLRVSREQALRQAREARVRVASPAVVGAPRLAGVSMAGAGPSGSAVLQGWRNEQAQTRAPSRGRRYDEGPLSWGWRLASALPVIALVAGLWGIQQWYQQEQVEAAADVDMALLTDDLPPTAYSDPGFQEYLRTNELPAASETTTLVAEPAPELNPAVPQTNDANTSPAPASATPTP